MLYGSKVVVVVVLTFLTVFHFFFIFFISLTMVVWYCVYNYNSVSKILLILITQLQVTFYIILYDLLYPLKSCFYLRYSLLVFIIFSFYDIVRIFTSHSSSHLSLSVPFSFIWTFIPISLICLTLHFVF